MAKSKDEEREHRILYEVIVDAYDDEEQAMGWYYYMAENLAFPIKAKVEMPMRGGKLEVKDINIVEIDPKSEEGRAIRLGIVEGKSERVQYLSPEHIVSLKTSDENLEIINDWLYWHDFELLS